jgi:hypothetical protein
MHLRSVPFRFLTNVALLILLASPIFATEVFTDREDYPPGDQVVIVGIDFWAFEPVTVQVTHYDGGTPSSPEYDPWTVIADDYGDFETYWMVPEDALGETLQVTATGQNSGLVATCLFTDRSTVMSWTTAPPATICPGETFEVCVNLSEKCTGGGLAPLENRAINFFLNDGDCGVDVGQVPDAVVYTDEYGNACATLTAPTTPGQYTVRPKFFGEDKPPVGSPGNSACNPGQRVQLSASNICEAFLSDPDACNDPPTCNVPGDQTIFQCTPIQVCLPVSCDDPDGNLLPGYPMIVSGPGSIVGTDWCYTPSGDEVAVVTIRCEDDDGAYCEATFTITFDINEAPVATCPGDDQIFVCDLSPITIGGFSCYDADGNLTSCVATGGTLSGDEVTFTPVAGANVITLTATDACGETDVCQTTITVTLNSPPVATCPGDDQMLVCDLSPITIGGFNCSDPDGNLTTCVATGGTLSGDQVTFTPVVGANVITLTATDDCGETDVCQTTITVTLNSPPVATCPGDDQIFVCDLSPITIGGFICSDPDANLTSCVATGGTLTGNDVTFTPVVGANVITLTATDACGETDVCQTTITVTLNSPPVATCPGDDQLFVCDLSPITIGGFTCSDPDGNLTSCVATGGTLSGDEVTFTPVVGMNTIPLTATDACGKVSTCVTKITVTINSPPVATCPGDDQLFVCDLSPITIGGFNCSDPDGNLTSCVATGGTLTGNDVTFTPVVGANVITLTATDACGETDVCQTTITVSMNNPPVATCPGDDQLFVCDLSPITIGGFDCSDPDGNLTSCVAIGGTLTGNDVTFTPVVGANVITLTATDACGETDVCQTTITVALNNPPVATCPGDDQLFVCDLSPITIGGFSCSDPDGNLTSCAATGGTLTGNDVTFTPVVGANVITLTAADACDETDVCQTTITVTLNNPPVATCPGDDQLFVCDLSPITIGGFSCSDPDGNLSTCDATGGTLVGDEVTFTPVVGANVITLTATDACDETDVCQTTITITLNSPPVATCPGDDQIFVCDLQSPITIGGFDCSDPDGNLTSCVATGGTLVGNEVTFTPVVGANVITLTATDACDETDVCQTTITVALNSPPVATCPGDQLLFVCDLSPITIDGFGCSDPDGNLTTCVVDGGTLIGDEVTFTPVKGVNTITLTATDACGETDVCQTVVTVDFNRPPTATCPSNVELSVCDLSEICINGFVCDDPDGNLASCTVNNGVLSGTQVCLTPTAGANTIILTATDECGEVITCQTTVTVTVNRPPTVTNPASGDMFVCDQSQICLDGFGCDDPDGNLVSCEVEGGIWNGNQVCFMPQTGPNTITITATDACGLTATSQTTINITINSPPTVSCPGDQVLYLFELEEVCIPGFGCSDVDGNLSNCVVTGGTLIGDEVCFMPVEGNNIITVSALDACGATAQCETNIVVQLVSGCPLVKISKEEGVIQGQYRDVTVTIENAFYELGGFDFLMSYDASALNFIYAVETGFLVDCDWEYFTYRHGAQGNCSGACPSGLLRVFALAEYAGGPDHPLCTIPPDDGPHELFKMRFYVTNDRTFECMYAPIEFFWYDCADNSISSATGDTLFIDRVIYNLEGEIIWDEEDDDQFPEDDRYINIGAPDICMINVPDKPTAIRCIDFQNGGIDIICADDIDDRGDLNLNGVSNEIADAVVFTNYFLQGLVAFVVNIDGQTAASDTNADGIPLSVADLVYIIRVINGDAIAYNRLNPYQSEAGFGISGTSITTNTELGAAFIVFEGNVPVSLAANSQDMDLKVNFDGQNTRALVYSFDKDKTFTGEFLHSGGTVISIESSDYDGNILKTGKLPSSFALECYPNPFNPSTNISLSLPIASDWNVEIYNISGRKVAAFSGYSEAGPVNIVWNADNSSSGVYFVKARAANHSASRKLILLK